MIIKTVKKITSWSYSRFSQYQKCPASAKYKFIDKLPEPPAPAMDRGIRIHKLAEDYTKGLIKKLPEELKFYKDQFEILKSSKPMVEQQWTFRQDWSQTTWNDWNSAWVRIKVDAACVDESTLYVIDHKTGKPKDDYDEQLSLYAMSGMLVMPQIKEINTQIWYLDHDVAPIEKIYKAKELKELQKGWEKKVAPMLNDTRFAPKPGNHCRWCAFSKTKGGPCKF